MIKQPRRQSFHRFTGSLPTPALSLCFTYELVQIDLQISDRIRIDHKTEDTIVR